jgi:apolipoprotein N-acyltransferase
MARLMTRRSALSKPKATVAQPTLAVPFAARWWGKLALLLLSVALLTFSYAPFKQFYLAWFALVPWLVVVRRCRSGWTAFFWSWLAGSVFFIANMWWLAYVTGPGMVALMILLGLYWGLAGTLIRATGLLDPSPRPGVSASPRPSDPGLCPGRAVVSVFGIATIWVATEWLRGTWPLEGLAWQYLGHSQSPVLYLCQIADIVGVFGISFWLMAINVLIALIVLYRPVARRLVPAGIAVAVMLAITLGYGIFRFSQHTTHAGPTVLVVQPNYPQSNTGEKGASQREILEFHLKTTDEALKKHPDVNLVVWSETMMPPLNPPARQFAATHDLQFWEYSSQQIASLVRRHNAAILTGGLYYDNWVESEKLAPIPKDRRNSAYFYLPTGQSELRYDKIHLVPFGEYLPFKSALPPLYKLFLSMSPYPEEYTLTAGSSDALTVFELKPDWRFVTPICFEDMDGDLLRRMFKPGQDGRKRADFIVNITNDGWFKYNEMPQHLQAAIFRSIEDRAPTARSVNTGISGFIDSLGRTKGLIPAGQEGTSVATLELDSRVTVYSRVGDLFAYACALITAMLIPVPLFRWWKRRSRIRGTKN